jgi:hypothetical protein
LIVLFNPIPDPNEFFREFDSYLRRELLDCERLYRRLEPGALVLYLILHIYFRSKHLSVITVDADLTSTNPPPPPPPKATTPWHATSSMG